MARKTTPEIIKSHPFGWLWGPAWRQMHNRRQQFNLVLTGTCGSGKSYAALSLAWLLDRGENGEPRFSMKNVAFDAESFAELASKPAPPGSTVLLDDAALTAFRPQTLSRQVSEISKIFVSMRHQRRLVILTLPTLDMLPKNIVATVENYAELQRIDHEKKQSVARFYRLFTNLRTGKLYFYRCWTMADRVHPTLGTTTRFKVYKPFVRFDMPPPELCKEYEKVRAEAMQSHYETSKRKLNEIKEGKCKAPSFEDEFVKVKENVTKYLDKHGKVDVGKIMLDGILFYRAKLIAKTINGDLKRKKNKTV